MKGIRPFIFVCLALLVFYLIAQFNRPRVTNWAETLKDNDTIPFGTYIVHKQMHDIFTVAKMIDTLRQPFYNVLNGKQFKNTAYLVIGKEVNISEADYGKLTTFIASGNDVFIAAETFGPYLHKKLSVETNYGFHGDDTIRIGFVNKTLNTVQYAIGKQATNNYFESFDTTKVSVLGQNDAHQSNFIKFTLGKGNLYLNANPLMFSNYSLLQNQGAAYAATALSFINNADVLLWDEYYSRGAEEPQNEMRVFLEHPALRWAWYIAFFSLLVFVLYQMKRRQRIIPVIEPLANSSVEFANVVGQVYYEQRDNRDIAQKKISYFLEFIRNRFNLKTNVLDAEFTTLLGKKSGMELEFVQRVISNINFIRNSKQVADADLISLNQNIEEFYTQAS